jgi:hypothetical protein
LSDITLKTVEELSQHEKLELIQFSATTYYKVICKLLEQEVIGARDIAMSVDPVSADKRIEQSERMTEAHAMAKFYARFVTTLESLAAEHIGELKAAAAEQIAQNREQIEAIVMGQAAGV